MNIEKKSKMLREDKSNTNAVFYGFQYAHHGKHSAFLGLKKEFEKRGVHVITAVRPQIFWKRGIRRLLPLWMKIQEHRLYYCFKSDSVKVVHYFFPENSMFFAPVWKSDKLLFMTCHQPVTKGFFDRVEKKRKYFSSGLKKADVIILMASNDIDVYQKFAPQAKVICIPHGVDTAFFSRDQVFNGSEKRNTNKRILTVGTWLRDYQFWADVVKEILKIRNDIEFTVIANYEAQQKIKHYFDGHVPSMVKMISGISDESLREMYANSDLLFLPLLDAWANNALLESAAMGLPVMATDLPAVREYLGDNLSICFTNDSAKSTAAKIQEILADKVSLIKRGKALRTRMKEQFSWETIADRHLELYRKLGSYNDKCLCI